jgi:hypothetical protein
VDVPSVDDVLFAALLLSPPPLSPVAADAVPFSDSMAFLREAEG